MPVVCIGEMRMGMGQCGMLVAVGMPARARLTCSMRMVVVPIVVPMGMGVALRCMGVGVFMPLSQVQGHTDRHQAARQRHRPRYRLAEPSHRQHRTQERCH